MIKKEQFGARVFWISRISKCSWYVVNGWTKIKGNHLLCPEKFNFLNMSFLFFFSTAIWLIRSSMVFGQLVANRLDLTETCERNECTHSHTSRIITHDINNANFVFFLNILYSRPKLLWWIYIYQVDLKYNLCTPIFKILIVSRI